MRVLRALAGLLEVLILICAPALLLGPAASADPPMRIPSYVTDRAGALKHPAKVRDAVDELYDQQHVRLWVVYVKDFGGASPTAWADKTIQASNLGDRDALLAVATEERSYAFQVASGIKNVSDSEIDNLRTNTIEPELRKSDWDGAAIETAAGLEMAASSSTSIPWKPVFGAIGLGAVLVGGFMLFSRLRTRARRRAEFEAARSIDPCDAYALASQPVTVLDDLSKSIVVNVDNAVRTSEAELALAVEEFGTESTAPFQQAVDSAKKALAQAFSVRKKLDDAVPETPLEQRRLLIDVITTAARADRILEDQSNAFDALRNLVLNAPAKLDALTQQVVAVTARLPESERILGQLRAEFDAAALTSIADNIQEATERVSFADSRITHGRELAARAVEGQQMNLVDAIRGAESALTQANTLLDAIDNAATDIRHATHALAASISETKSDISQAEELQKQGKLPSSAELTNAHDAAVAAVANAERIGATDPLTAFTHLATADAQLDKLLATAQEEKAAADRRARVLDQALVAARQRLSSVNQYIGLHRGAVGAQTRSNFDEAQRRLASAEQSRESNPSEAIMLANSATELATQAQYSAQQEVHSAQRYYSNGYGGYGMAGNVAGGVAGGVAGNVAGAVIGGILRGMISGGSGYHGSWSGSGSSSYGGSSRSSGSSFRGGGGRF